MAIELTIIVSASLSIPSIFPQSLELREVLQILEAVTTLIRAIAVLIVAIRL